MLPEQIAEKYNTVKNLSTHTMLDILLLQFLGVGIQTRKQTYLSF